MMRLTVSNDKALPTHFTTFWAGNNHFGKDYMDFYIIYYIIIIVIFLF